MIVPFTGIKRQELVDELDSAFEVVCDLRQPLWFSLEANTGWGKTRIIQEWYSRLAANQADPPYWAPTIQGTDEEHVNCRRKRVAPSTTTRPGAIPYWFWWGFSCSTRNDGRPVSALVQDMDCFEDHAAALEARFRGLSSRTTQARTWFRQRRGETAGTVAGEIAGAAAAAANLAVPGIGLALLVGKWGLQAGHERLRDSQETPRGGDVVSDAASWLQRFALAGIPLIIVVEDLHESDAVLCQMLARVLNARDVPIMVVTTSWRGLIDQPHRPAHELLDRVGDEQRRRVRCEEEAGDLGPEDLMQIVETVLPGFDDESRGRLAARFPNPYALQLACQVPRIERAAAVGTIRESDLRTIPSGVAGLFRELWLELPDPVRRVLTVASQLAPGTVSERLGFGDLRWDPHLVADVVNRLTWLTVDLPDLGQHITDSDEAYSWIRTVEEWLQRFHDPAQHGIAAGAFVTDDYSSDELSELLSAARTTPSVTPPSERATHRDRLLVALAAEGHAPWDDDAAEAAVRLCGTLLQAPGTVELQSVVTICQEALAHQDAP